MIKIADLMGLFGDDSIQEAWKEIVKQGKGPANYFEWLEVFESKLPVEIVDQALSQMVKLASDFREFNNLRRKSAVGSPNWKRAMRGMASVAETIEDWSIILGNSKGMPILKRRAIREIAKLMAEKPS